MSSAEILAELPKLKAEERKQVFQRLCELQEADLLHGVGPTEEEKKLLDEAEGILAWAVKGAVRWYAEGLARPPEVNEAVATWRAESDPLRDFLEEHCDLKPDLWCLSGDLWKAYEDWAESSGVDPLSRTAFNGRLRDMGLKAGRRKEDGKTKRSIEGITLLG